MPSHNDHAILADLVNGLTAGPPWMVITGAGISTASGIPDYRDAKGEWKRPRPVYFQPFMSQATTRARYWARSMVGWRFFSGVHPNAGHYAVHALQQRHYVDLIVTQNVDGLHEKAGSTAVVDLHGRLDRVRCMQCGNLMARQNYQALLEQSNPQWLQTHAPIAPDGDAELEDADFSQFHVVPCPLCAGIMKPDVVFYGENVPPERHQQATQAQHQAGGLLILGTSLMVQSSYRYAVLAAQLGKPIAIINQGMTRADALATITWNAAVEEALSMLEKTLP